METAIRFLSSSHPYKESVHISAELLSGSCYSPENRTEKQTNVSIVCAKVRLRDKRRAYFCKSIAMKMGGVSRYFSKALGSAVNSTPLIFGVPVVQAFPLLKAGHAEEEQSFCSLYLYLPDNMSCNECARSPVFLRKPAHVHDASASILHGNKKYFRQRKCLRQASYKSVLDRDC